MIMMLSEAAAWVAMEVRRDHSFANLGFLSDSQPDKLVFVEHPRAAVQLARVEGVCCVLTTPELAGSIASVRGLAITETPRAAFFELHNRLAGETDFYGCDSAAAIDPTARIHPRACVAGKNVRIGSCSVVEANVTIEERTVIGAGVRVRAGVVLGSIGFQLSRWRDGVIEMAHAGWIEIGNQVDILSNAVIARGLFRQSTIVGDHSRIGNLAFLSHNVRIGARCFVGHHAVINGNVTVGEDAWIGPGATVSHNLTIGAGAHVALGSTVIRNVGAGERSPERSPWTIAVCCACWRRWEWKKDGKTRPSDGRSYQASSRPRARTSSSGSSISPRLRRSRKLSMIALASSLV